MVDERQLPTILLTGTPGTGKTTHAEMLEQASPVPLRHINIGELVKEKGLYESYDNDWQTYIVDEDKLIDELEPIASRGGVILDWHTCDVFPERWIDLVVVLRCNHSLLWDRLEQRDYSLKKIQENNESEIMQTVLDDARESYAEEIVIELQSNETGDLTDNIERIVQWVDSWRKQRGFNDPPT